MNQKEYPLQSGCSQNWLNGHKTRLSCVADRRGIFLLLISLIGKGKKRNHQTAKRNHQTNDSYNIRSHHNYAPPFLCNPVTRNKTRRLPPCHGYSRVSTRVNCNIFDLRNQYIIYFTYTFPAPDHLHLHEIQPETETTSPDPYKL